MREEPRAHPLNLGFIAKVLGEDGGGELGGKALEILLSFLLKIKLLRGSDRPEYS